MNNWKAIRKNLAADMNGPIELYDLAKDPAEQTNVAAQHADLVTKFQQIFKMSHVPSSVFHFMP